jgi:hypothetical protein
MMNLLNHQKYRYLLLIPVIFLILNAFFFMYATKEIRSALLNEKYLEIVDMTEMLGAALEANENRLWFDHERNVRASVEYIDNIHQIYGSVFRPRGDQLIPITRRVYETTEFDPREHQEFIYAVYAQEKGELTLGYAPEDQEYRDIHLYFRWMPLYSPFEDRYLVVTGVSEHSIVTQISVWVSAGQWASMVITFVLNAWLIGMLANHGYDYKHRTEVDISRSGGDSSA